MQSGVCAAARAASCLHGMQVGSQPRQFLQLQLYVEHPAIRYALIFTHLVSFYSETHYVSCGEAPTAGDAHIRSSQVQPFHFISPRPRPPRPFPRSHPCISCIALWRTPSYLMRVCRAFCTCADTWAPGATQHCVGTCTVALRTRVCVSTAKPETVSASCSQSSSHELEQCANSRRPQFS